MTSLPIVPADPEIDRIRVVDPAALERDRVERINICLGIRDKERQRFETLHAYSRGKQAHPALPTGAPAEVRKLAEMSRVNILRLVVASVVQSMFVDGYRSGSSAEEEDAWEVWQANGMDARQSGVHRAALTYGTSYASILPGDPNFGPNRARTTDGLPALPVIRGHSPRNLIALYAGDEDWPEFALELDWLGHNWRLRLYDEANVYTYSRESLAATDSLRFIGADSHSFKRPPIVRFTNTVDLDDDNEGELDDLLAIQDQIDHTTFDLLVAQHYAAFKQRYVIGWTAANENALLKAGASKLMTFDDPDVKLGEFTESDLGGYLNSREASIRHAAALSQTPSHELIGEMINLSAEALVAAETSQRRKITERMTSFGESWEQVLWAAGLMMGAEPALDAQVRWRDTESRSLSQTVDALGKIASLLGVPVEVLWERLPGTTQQDVERWKEAKAAEPPTLAIPPPGGPPIQPGNEPPIIGAEQ